MGARGNGGELFRWQHIHFSSRPTRQILIMIPFPIFESSLNLLSPRFFCALVFMLNLYTVTVNVPYYFFFKFI